jgi:hypothetical protein
MDFSGSLQEGLAFIVLTLAMVVVGLVVYLL